MKNLIKYWLPVVLYAGLIFTVSSMSGKDIPGLFPFQDVVFHFLEYAIFGLLISRALKGCNPGINRRKRFLLVMALILAHALLDEFHQLFVPGRSASLGDAVVDAVGACTAYFYKA